MNGTQEAPAGAPLAAHFEAKRRILATVKQMEERGEKLEEATLDEVLEAANKAEETVFKFDFSLSGDGQEEGANETSNKKRSRNRKRNKKRRGKKPQDDKKADDTTERSAPVTPAQRGNAKNANANGANKQKMQEAATNAKAKAARGGPSSTSSSFLKLRKATGTESEVAKMHLRYGQGRRNLTASKQREQRKKAASEHKETDDFKFNFEDSS